jgi:Carboxypeptidase regulatory-like domain/TonB dependent receptor
MAKRLLCNFAVLAALIAVLMVATVPSVVAQVPTGTVNGLISDPREAVVPNARVVAVSKAQGVSRETTSNADGLYVITDLAPGDYDLKIEAPGFAPSEFTEVSVQAGRTITLDAKLQIAGVGTIVNVNEGAGEVDLTQSMIQGQITSTTIDTIPLNGRNFLELAYLIPGNRPAPNFDPTKTNTLEVSSAGGFGRGGNITVDGGDNNDEVVGGTLSNFPQDSIQEFQIATGRFTSEVGRSGNSIINVVTKSGGNDIHGSAFFYERNRVLQGLPATFDRSQQTPPFHREQFGGSAGGPIVKDRAWWFASLEYRYQNAAIQTGERDFTTDAVLHTAAPANLRDLLFSTRFDDQLTTRNRLMVRYSFNRSTDINQASLAQPSPSISAAERQDSLNRFHSFVAGVTTTISNNKANDASFHFDNFYNNLPPFSQNSPTTNPAGLASTNELLFPSLADGANYNLPQATYLNRYQLREAFSWTLGKHALRLGGEFQRYSAHGIINVFGTGTVILVSDFGFADLNGDGAVNDLDIPIAVALKSSAPVSPVPIPHIANNYLAGYVQDDWRVRSNLTLNLGLRWEYDTDLLGNDSAHGPCPDLTSEPDRPCVWLANVIDLHRTPDKKSFGPRVGFAWDPFGKGKTVVRGGYGIYYDRIILEAPSLERVQDNRQLTVAQFAGSSCTFPGNPGPPSLGLCFAGIPGEGFAPGSPTLADPFSGPNQTGGGGLIALSKDSHHPLFQQFSIGVQQQLGNNWLFSADGLHVFGYNQLIGQFLRTTDSTSPDISCSGNNVPCVVTDPLTGISDNVTELGSFAKSWYDGLIVSVQHRPTKLGRFTYLYNINYTFSKTLDYSDDDQLTNGNADEAVNLVEGTVGLPKEKGYASSDERHRLTLFGQLQMPWGFSFSPIYTFGSGVPANTALSGLPVAFNPDQTVTSRIPILSRNAIGRSIKNSDQLNAIIEEWNALPACPAPAPCNAGGAIRTVPAGINFFSPFSSLDFRLTKEIRLGERMRLSLIGEAFNIFNFTNVRGTSRNSYAGRNIAISPDTPTDHIQTDFYNPVSVAGGFFGAGGPRAFQFAARFSF